MANFLRSMGVGMPFKARIRQNHSADFGSINPEIVMRGFKLGHYRRTQGRILRACCPEEKAGKAGRLVRDTNLHLQAFTRCCPRTGALRGLGNTPLTQPPYRWQSSRSGRRFPKRPTLSESCGVRHSRGLRVSLTS